MVRSCVDGPVFRGEQVRWDDIGTIPFDAFGAPGWESRAGAQPAAAPDAALAPAAGCRQPGRGRQPAPVRRQGHGA